MEKLFSRQQDKPFPELEGLQINSFLAGFGDVFKLGFKIPLEKLKMELEYFKNDWRQYNTYKPHISRQGLSLTSLDGKLHGGTNLESLTEIYNRTGNLLREKDFQRFTEVYDRCPSLKVVLDEFAPLGRSHFIKLGNGGYFPPHRDHDHDCFRLIIPCFNSRGRDFVFMLEDRKLNLTPGCVYYINTRKSHSVFSFQDDCTLLILNVMATMEIFKKIRRNLFPL